MNIESQIYILWSLMALMALAGFANWYQRRHEDRLERRNLPELKRAIKERERWDRWV